MKLSLFSPLLTVLPDRPLTKRCDINGLSAKSRVIYQDFSLGV
jgi:hypothetical protein